MVFIFREKSPVSVFWLIALSVVLHSHFIIVPPQVLISKSDGWSATLLSSLAALPSFAVILLYHAIVVVQALRISAVLNHLRLFPKLYFIPALCYLLLTSLYPAWNNISAPLLINFFVIWLFSLTAKMYNAPQSRPLIYNIGFITGTISLIYSPALFLIPASFFALSLLRAFRLNEWMILLLGVLTPAYLLAAVFFLNDNVSLFLHYMPRFQWHVVKESNHIALLIACITGGLVVVAGIIAWQGNIGKMIIQTRRAWSVLFIMLLLSIPLLFALKGEDSSALLLMMMPAAALASNTFVYSKNELLQTILFWVLVIVIIFNNWFWLKT